MTYSVGKSGVTDYANTSSGKVTNVVADDGLGGAGVVTDVTDRVALNFVVDTNIQFLTIDVTSLDDYVAGKSDVTITVNPNVYVYGTPPLQQYPAYPVTPVSISTPDASMQIIGGSVGDTIKLVNNGNIVGFGGDGGGVFSFEPGCSGCFSTVLTSPGKGNAALSFITPGISLAIENNGYIAGGGGGGGSSNLFFYTPSVPGGGGGAGGGISGVVGLPFNSSGGSTPTVRAVPPNAGNNGVNAYVLFGCCSSIIARGGGGGGFVLPGTGGTYDIDLDIFGGGGAGGSGAGVSNFLVSYQNNGGSANNAAPTYTRYDETNQGGGGGGWGASGAAGYENFSLIQVGAAGGNSIITNGNAYTLTGSGTLYGSVDTAIRSVVYTFPTTVYSGTQFDIASISGYAALTNVVLIVPANVRLASNDNLSPGLDIFKSGVSNNPTSIKLIVNGAILGAGGRGGSNTTVAIAGGDAILLSVTGPTYIIDNTNGYVASGGGGGGRSVTTGTVRNLYGGGGAGYGGSSGASGNFAYNVGVASGVSVGNNGTVVVDGATTYASGGSGGTILPGTITNNPTLPAVGTYAGLGGQAGGSGAFHVLTAGINSPGNYGGAYKLIGGSAASNSITQAGGGGGWGANGGSGRRGANLVQSGAVAGNAVKLSFGSSVYITSTANIAGTIGV
jgi:hypothetical protein